MIKDWALACMPPSELTADECTTIMREEKMSESQVTDQMLRDSPWLPKVSVFALMSNLDEMDEPNPWPFNFSSYVLSGSWLFQQVHICIAFVRRKILHACTAVQGEIMISLTPCFWGVKCRSMNMNRQRCFDLQIAGG